MSLSNEALQKLLQEIEQKAAFSQQQIGIVKAQIASKQRENRMLQLTTSEMNLLPSDANVYEGVGRMFVASPTADVKSRLSRESDSLKIDVGNLDKKLNYLETTYKNSREHLDQLFKNGGR